MFTKHSPFSTGSGDVHRCHHSLTAQKLCTWRKQQQQHRTLCKAGKGKPDSKSMAAQSFPEVGRGKKLLIIGGTGRVGASTASALRETHPNLEIILSSQSQASYDAAVESRPELKGLEFRIVNRDDIDSLTEALKGVDVVLHTAGPFQRKYDCLVLEAAIQAKTPYIGECLTSHVTPLAVYHSAWLCGLHRACLTPYGCI